MGRTLTYGQKGKPYRQARKILDLQKLACHTCKGKSTHLYDLLTEKS